MKKLFSTVLGIAAFAVSFAANANYTVSAQLLDDEKVIASPSMVLEANKQASVGIDGRYKLDLTVAPEQDDLVRLTTNISLAGQAFSPEMLLKLDQPATVTIGDKTFRVTVKKST